MATKYAQYIKDITMPLPAEILRLLSLLEESGFESFVVGGAVRDLFLGKVPYDYDITTSAAPDDMISIFSEYKVIPTGLKHGTITVLASFFSVEITTYRIDGEYINHRQPKDVHFSGNLLDDLSRRDFTMNSLAYNPTYGIVDPFNGADDIENGIIKCVGDPLLRFEEDSLRIMRGLRFSSSLGFIVEKNTANAMKEKSELLSTISVERLARELMGVLNGNKAYEVLTCFKDIFSLLFCIGTQKAATRAPDFASFATFSENCATSDDNRLAVLAATIEPYIRKKPINLSSLFLVVKLMLFIYAFTGDENSMREEHSVEKSCSNSITKGFFESLNDISMTFLRKYKFDNKTINLASAISHFFIRDTSKFALRKALNRIGEEGVISALIFIYCHETKAKNKDKLRPDSSDFSTTENASRQNFTYGFIEVKNNISALIKLLVDILCDDEECYTLAKLAINGRDLKEISTLKPIKYGAALDFLLDAVMSGAVRNEKEALISHLYGTFFPQ